MNNVVVIEKIYHLLKRYHRLFFVILLCLAIIMASLIFYQDIYTVMQTKIAETDFKKSIKKDNLDEILKNIEARENKLAEVAKKNYREIFFPEP